MASNNQIKSNETTIREIAEVAGFLWERGWAERNAGNISVRLSGETYDQAPKEESRRFTLTEAYEDLSGACLYVTGTNRRMRDVASRPLDNGLIIRLDGDGVSYYVISPHEKTDLRPTSELATHLGIHSMLAKRKSDKKVVIHTHATELAALTQIQEFCDGKKLNTLLWGMHPETKVFIPAGVAFVPYALPGTTAIGEATLKALEHHDVALWEKHGVFAVGRDAHETFDLIDILAKSARIWFLCRSAGKYPEGLTDSQTDELGKLKF